MKFQMKMNADAVVVGLLVVVAVVLAPVIPPPLPQSAVPNRATAIDGGNGGGGCPYQVSAGRQKEEVASANIELDRRESEIYVAASKKKTRGRSSTLGGRFLPGFLEKGRNRFIWKL